MSSINIISVDVEDYFHAESFSDVAPRSQWDSYPSRVEHNTRRLLELFAKQEVKATFFVLGWVAERFPQLVRDIAGTGHEVACHSYWHRLIYSISPAQFREDTRRAKQVIEQAGGQPVYGYRAPTYSIVKQSLWALDVLAEEGFTYDSSIFPVHHDRYGIPDAPRFPFRVKTRSGYLVEYPITTFRLWSSHNFPVGGGGYLRILPRWYTRWGLRRARREGVPVIAYLHPWEIDPDQPRLRGRLLSRLRHYTNLSQMCQRIIDLLRTQHFANFRNSGVGALLEEVDLEAWVGA